MRIRDWRRAEAGLLRGCYDAERRYWASELAWDTSWTWSTIERARTTWGLPGLVAVDPRGRPVGWTFYMVDGGRLNLGGLVAADEGVTNALLDGILGAADDIEAASCFILDRAPGLAAALEARGFGVERFRYLSRPLPDSPSPVVSPPPVEAASNRPDVAGLALLLHASYTADSARHFAPDGSSEDWTRYVDGLVHHRGCGTFDPSATCVVGDEHGLQGAALMTSLSPTTAHLAQLAVRPDRRGLGLARRLLDEATARAARAGKREMTLIVGERNRAARRLYEGVGFRPRALFIAGDRRTSRCCSAAGPASSASLAAGPARSTAAQRSAC